MSLSSLTVGWTYLEIDQMRAAIISISSLAAILLMTGIALTYQKSPTTLSRR